MYVNAKGIALRDSDPTNYWVSPGYVGATRQGTNGNDVFYSSGNETLLGGLGDDSYHIWDAATKIVEDGSAGIDTVYVDYWGSFSLGANIENVVVANKGISSLTGNKLDNIIKLGPTGATVDAGAGDDVIIGGAGADVFKIAAGNGSDAIVNFRPGWDIVQLSGYNISNFSLLLAKAQQKGADVLVQLSSTEQLVLRDIQLASLSAADFNLPITATFPATALTHFTQAYQGWNSNGWYVFNNVFNVDGYTEGKDFKIESHFNQNNMADGTSFSWSFPVTTDPFPMVRAFPEVIFGHSPLNPAPNDPTDFAKVFPAKVGDLISLTADHDVSYSGNLGGFNVAYDMWLSKSPTATGRDVVSNEVMIWVHKGAFDGYGSVVGTYTDANGNTAQIYYEGTYTAVIFDKDLPDALIDVKDVFAKLQSLGIVSADEYVRSVELGAEVVSGSGTLTFNNLDLKVETRTEGGGSVTKFVTGTGTEVTTVNPPAPANERSKEEVVAGPSVDWQHRFTAGTEQLKDQFGKSAGTRTTTITPNQIEVVTKDTQGRVTGIERATTTADRMTIMEYDGSGNFLGKTVELRNADGSVWVNEHDAAGRLIASTRTIKESATVTLEMHYDGNSKLTGYDKITTGSSNVVIQHYDGNYKLTSAEKVVYESETKTTTFHYNAGYQLTESERAVVNPDGKIGTQIYNASGQLIGMDLEMKVGTTEVRTLHYTATGILTGAHVVQDMGKGVIKDYDVDVAWKTLSAKLLGTAGADTLLGGAYSTDFFGGKGADLITCGTGMDRIFLDTAIGKGEADQIKGFASGKDKIVLDDDIFTALSPGSLGANAFVLGTSARDADDRIFYDKSKGALYYDDDGNGAHAAVLIATFTDFATVSFGDFLIIA